MRGARPEPGFIAWLITSPRRKCCAGLSLVQTLEPIDRRVILLYLEDVDAASIGEITGLSARNVSTKIHRIKQVLAKRFHEGPSHDR